MREYETSTEWGGRNYARLSKKDRAKTRKFRVAPCILLPGIVIDELRREVILCGQTILDGNLDALGISICRNTSRWHSDTADCSARCRGSLEASYPAAARKLQAAQAAEISSMEAELAAAFESFSRAEDAWEALFPPDPRAPVDTNPSFLYGDWQFDKAKTARVLKRLGGDPALIAANLEHQLEKGRSVYRILPGVIALLVDGRLACEDEFCGCKRRGNRVTIRSRIAHGRKRVPVTMNYWCDGRFLIDKAGSAYKRLRFPTRKH